MTSKLRVICALGLMVCAPLALLCMWWKGWNSPFVMVLVVLLLVFIGGLGMANIGDDKVPLKEDQRRPIDPISRLLFMPLWRSSKSDKVPDYLAQAGFNYWEREGLCFVFVPEVEGQRCYLTLVYQNRYDSPCCAEFLVKPAPQSSKLGLKRLRFAVNCEASGFGQKKFPWGIPKALQGQAALLDIAASVSYPQGLGLMVRFQSGIPVGELAGLDETGDLFSVPARLELTLPTGVDEDIPAEAPGQSLSPHATQKQSTDRSAPSPVGETVAAGLQRGNQPERADTGQNPTMDSTVPPQLNEASLERLLNSFADDPGLKRHRSCVRRMKSDEQWKTLGLSALGVCAGAAFFGLGVWFFREGRWLGGIFLIIAGVGIGGSTLFVLLAGLLSMLTGQPVDAARSIHDACTAFYKEALTQFKDHGSPTSPFLEFVQVCDFFALPVLLTYTESSSAAIALMRKWRDLRERFVADETALEITGFEIEEAIRPDRRVVDVVVHVRGKPFGELTFCNAAFRVDDRWFLATPEPLLRQPER